MGSSGYSSGSDVCVHRLEPNWPTSWVKLKDINICSEEIVITLD